MKKIYLLLLLSGIVTASTAQTTTHPVKKGTKKARPLREGEELVNDYEKEFGIGARVNTDGWTGVFELGRRKNRKTVNFYQVEFSEKKDPKEDRKPGAIDPNGFGYSERSYILGKINNFYQFKLGIGQRQLIGSRANKNGVEVTYFYYGGLSLGMLRPYYVKMVDPVDGNRGVIEVKYSPAIDEQWNDPNEIYGAGSITKGWSEMSFVPGVHGKTGMRFDWAHSTRLISALEIGVNAEYYTKDVQIMADRDGKKFFFNAFLGLQFGKWWNKK
ncbi:hypothetical protein [Chitinophaga parva]|uniref:hypothetical protein n=1 Tax=Chitinophaga parva TaxID=2169414 RepID=UPI001057573D|nr:hypothetical protein [Chitinophaga parva]